MAHADASPNVGCVVAERADDPTLTSAVALAHDYLTQRGGAERVVLALTRVFPDAELHTALYEPHSTFADFATTAVRTGALDRAPIVRRNHRLGLPLYAWDFSRRTVDAPVTLCSSSGWAHGVRVTGRKVVYCYNPARWLYQSDLYLGSANPIGRIALSAVRAPLRRWDRRAAFSAHRYIAISTAVRDRIWRTYGIEADLIAPPHSIDPTLLSDEIADVEPGFFLCVSRLLPYKNVDAVVDAFRGLPSERLVVVGTGPEGRRLSANSPKNVSFLGAVSDAQLRWAYKHAAGLIAVSYEDFGLTPLEAAAFGTPALVLRWGGFLDTTIEGVTGVFCDRPSGSAVAAGLAELRKRQWDADAIVAHAQRYSEPVFAAKMLEIVERELCLA